MFAVDFNLSFSTQIEGNQCVTFVADPIKIPSASSRSAEVGSIALLNGERPDHACVGESTASLISQSCVQLWDPATYDTKVASDNAGESKSRKSSIPPQRVAIPSGTDSAENNSSGVGLARFLCSWARCTPECT
ncbi:MAG TPA: hypothetical protein IGS52_07190 [Oscillatoriaceae cyanobacterium M33_DOE_052]|uniref:Uncharacterized protein n=1 Tax=Planktothricoides sp. SpSt-374 TaxID=2282167 RepID=A0A7C3VM46_9CYAN|nr:hypothetical protein [Oscillatoriaceae cyanobacterium M33_DOE_052]